MQTPFFQRSHGCPDCGGMVEWRAQRCGYCRHEITFVERCLWVDGWAKPMLLALGFGGGSLFGLIALHTPASLVSMGIAVALGFWSVLRVSPLERTNALGWRPPGAVSH